MNNEVLLDKLSEFLMVEQCGWQLYRVVESRTTDKELKERYQEFGRETDRHRAILTGLIHDLGGDPDYVSPTARLAQAKSEALLASALVSGPLGEAEREASDLENVLLAETKDHADWELLSKLTEQLPNGKTKTAIEAAVAEVEPQEDEHLEWAQTKLAALAGDTYLANLSQSLTRRGPGFAQGQSRGRRPCVALCMSSAQPPWTTGWSRLSSGRHRPRAFPRPGHRHPT